MQIAKIFFGVNQSSSSMHYLFANIFQIMSRISLAFLYSFYDALLFVYSISANVDLSLDVLRFLTLRVMP